MMCIGTYMFACVEQNKIIYVLYLSTKWIEPILLLIWHLRSTKRKKKTESVLRTLFCILCCWNLLYSYCTRVYTTFPDWPYDKVKTHPKCVFRKCSTSYGHYVWCVLDASVRFAEKKNRKAEKNSYIFWTHKYIRSHTSTCHIVPHARGFYS